MGLGLAHGATAMTLSVVGITRNFGGVVAVDDVSLSLSAGERRVIIGPNGAGKTTLFNLLTGTLMPDSGEVVLLGHKITRIAPHRRARLGLRRTFQIPSLLRGLTVFDNAHLAVQSGEPLCWAPYAPPSTFQKWRSRTEELLAEWHLTDFAGTLVKHLSHGFQRQLEIALALAHQPKLLLLDEPTQGLSPADTELVANAIKGISREITILMIEHDLAVAFALADRITVMHQGRVLVEGGVQEIQENPEVTEIYVGIDDPDDAAS
jgi:branched-chain amino acid transport system ATP-binding protein